MSAYSSYREQAEKLIDRAFFDEFMKGLNDGKTPKKLPEAQKLKGYNELQKSLDALLKSSFGEISSTAKSELMYAYTSAFNEAASRTGAKKVVGGESVLSLANATLSKSGYDGKATLPPFNRFRRRCRSLLNRCYATYTLAAETSASTTAKSKRRLRTEGRGSNNYCRHEARL